MPATPCPVPTPGTRRSRRAVMTTLVAALTTLLSLVPAAATAAPANDARTTPTDLSLRGSVAGTLADASLEGAPPAAPGAAPVTDLCNFPVIADVWYSVSAPRGTTPVVFRLAGNALDAVISVQRVTGTGAVTVDCDATDADHRAGVRARVPSQGATFLVRVGLRSTESDARRFQLGADPAPAPPRFPGRRLPARGGLGTVDALANTADAWSARLHTGTTYRINLAHGPTRCVALRVFSPQASWNDEPSYGRACGGYMLVTPGPGLGGRWTFRVETSTRRRDQPYRLSVAPAGRDDIAPGLALRDRRSMRGRLTGGGADAVDLYRIDVTERSHVVLRLRTAARNGFNLRLLSTRGRTVQCDCGDRGSLQVRKGLQRGRYYVEVRARHRARGAYTLRRIDRTLTGTSLRVEGSRRARLRPGETASLTLEVHPAGVSGPADVRIERFDPLTGWHFSSQRRVHVHSSRATLSFLPPAEGAWRAAAFFRGTNRASPSDSRWVRIRVQAPLGRAARR